MDLLKELRLEELTAVFFTGDNGGQDRFKSKEYPRGYFGPNVNPKTGIEFRGGKGNLYEGGLRIPFLVRWPGHISSGRVSDFVFYQPDMLPTISELCGARIPNDTDGISIVPTLIGEEMVGRSQEIHKMMYWEYLNQVAVRFGNWKAIKTGKGKQSAWALYDLEADISEYNDLSLEKPDILTKMMDFAKKSHRPARPGVYIDPQRQKHNRDRQAKYGFSKNSSFKKNKNTKD